MRQFLKFLHTMGAIGLLGAMISLLILLSLAPAPASLAEYALVRGQMAAIGKWMFMPSLALTLIAGLLAIAANRAYQNAGWAWAKAATGILIFESGLGGIQGPIEEEAKRSASVLAGQLDPTALAQSLGAERNTLLIIAVLAVANVVLGIWRPRFTAK